MPRRLMLAALLFACDFFAGCASGQGEARAVLADNFFEVIGPPSGVLAALHQARVTPRLLTVFIEGDGAPWPRPASPPADPTPDNPLALHLAVSHALHVAQPGEAVAYLARPCQYLTPQDLAHCPPQWWTTGRFGEAPLALLNAGLDQLRQRVPGASVRLVGYSGGGAVAALLAAKRADVECLVTVAAPLDTDAWTRIKNVSPLSESRNPADAATALRGRRMTHFSGTADNVVLPETNQRFMALAESRETSLQGFNHDSQWLSAWPELVPASCLGP